jgi:3-hydroxyacyl-CoA dehydrogenase
VPKFDADEAGAVRDKVVARARHRPAAVKAADLVLGAAQKPFRQALAEERAVFHDIRTSPEAFALRHVFFAERDAGRSDSAEPGALPIDYVGVVGGGTMGAAIAHALLSSGYQVILMERSGDALIAGEERIAGLRANDLRRGRIDDTAATRQAAALTGSVELSDAAGVDLVIEAVFEDIAVKREVLAQLGAVITPEAIVATNTSYLNIDEMAEVIPNPERFLGLHFFAPAHVMKLLEVVKAAQTNAQTLSTTLALAKRLGKQVVIARNAFGFIGNRVYNAYRRHAEFLIQEGASPQTVDLAMTDFGMAMGPFAVADLSGLDVAWRMRKAQKRSADLSVRYVDVLDRLCEAGRLGRKTGAGYYDYASGHAEADDALEVYLEASRKSAGIRPRVISDDEIRMRCIGAMVNEGARLLSEDIARRASDIDVAMIHGYGFPRWTGGPVWWAAHLADQDLKGMIEEVAKAEGPGFLRGDVNALIADLFHPKQMTRS